MTDFSFEEISVFLPKWLSPAEQSGLFNELKKLPSNIAFYDHRHEFDNDTLQGDGWKGLAAIDFFSVQKKAVSGVILSNSCDIDTSNRRDIAPNVLFSPLIRLSKFAELLSSAKLSAAEIDSRLETIRAQRVTSLFYLPRCENVIEESVIVLDDVHRHPLHDFSRANRTKLFTLTQTAFYLFLMKLSIHFTRVNDRVRRHIP